MSVECRIFEVAKTPEDREAWGDSRREIFCTSVKMKLVPERVRG